MTECKKCGKEAYMAFRCKQCDDYFCNEHRLPELHGCTVTKIVTVTSTVQREITVEELVINDLRKVNNECYYHLKNNYTSGLTRIIVQLVIDFIFWLMFEGNFRLFGIMISGSFALMVGWSYRQITNRIMFFMHPIESRVKSAYIALMMYPFAYFTTVIIIVVTLFSTDWYVLLVLIPLVSFLTVMAFKNGWNMKRAWKELN